MARLALSLFEYTVAMTTLNAKTATLAFNLYSMAAKAAAEKSIVGMATRLRSARALLGDELIVKGAERKFVAGLKDKLNQIEIKN